MADAKSGAGSSTTVVALAALLALGAGGAVYWYYDQAAKAEKTLLQAKGDYRDMSERMKKPVEDYVRRTKGQPPGPKEDSTGDLLTFLDRKAREAQVPPGSLVIAKNSNSTVGDWIESSYTATLQGTKDAPAKKVPLIDFLGRVERERRSTKTKSLQITFVGEDLKQAVVTFSQFQHK